MTVDFNDYFWGEKNNGYEVLYHNMKHGVTASKELMEYFKERSNLDEHNSKVLLKLAHKVGSSGTSGTFSPLLIILKTSAERLSELHTQMMQKTTELVKNILKYADELHKKHKTVKDEESSTQDAVHQMKESTLAVQKAKDLYQSRLQELEKLRRDNASAKEIEKAEAKLKKHQDEYKNLAEKHNPIKQEFEQRMTATCKRFQDVEEAHLKQMKEFITLYIEIVQNNHDLIGQVHSDFKRQFLDLTVDKLLEQFVLNKYTGLEKPAIAELELSSVGSVQLSQIKNDTSASSKVNELHDIVMNSSMMNKPHNLQEASHILQQQNLPTSVATGQPIVPHRFYNQNETEQAIDADTSISQMSGFLRSRRDKKPSKRKDKKKKDGETSNNKEEAKSDTEEKGDALSAVSSGSVKPDLSAHGDSSKITLNVTPTLTALSASENVPTATHDVNEEEYNEKAPCNTWNTNKNESSQKNKFYSSSDSESEDEIERKIHVEIKPLNNGAPISASVDELRATVENLSLSPIGALSTLNSFKEHKSSQNENDRMKRSQSLSQQMADKVSDITSLNHVFQQHHQSPMQSNASTPTTAHPYAPLASPTLSMTNNSASNRYADLDIFSEVGELLHSHEGASLNKIARQIPTPNSSIAIPRPPSRRSEQIRTGRNSPLTMTRADSVGSLEFRTVGAGLGSRGPSPLTIGMSDTIPLAIAFHEIIHAFFKGSDESRCQVKMSGDMMLSFPAGIVNVLTNNPNPAKLCFRIKNVQNLENVLPNKQLINLDKLQPTNRNITLEFNMPALTLLLRRQSEQNPTASYFNVDILKYTIKSKDGAKSCPFQLVSYWKCEPTHTDIKIDYKYNSHAMTSPSPLLNVSITVPVDGGVRNVQSKPHSAWLGESNKLVWNFTDVSQYSDNEGVDTLRARLEVRNGPSTPSILSTQFNCEGTTLSGIDFELSGTGYRISLVKRRFVAGKYICEGDGIRSNAKPPTPIITSPNHIATG